MTSTNFHCSSEVVRAFTEAKTNPVRYLQLEIEKETVILVTQVNMNVMRAACELNPKHPYYFLYSTADSFEGSNNNWIFVSYVSEGSSIRDRMLYSCTKETLKNQLGIMCFVKDYHAVEIDDMNFETYKYKMMPNKSSGPTNIVSEIFKTDKEDLASPMVSIMKPTSYSFTPSLISYLKDRQNRPDIISLVINEDDESIGMSDKSNEYKQIEDLKYITESQYLLISKQRSDLPKTDSRLDNSFRNVDEENLSKMINIFVLFNPPNTSNKLKMLYSYTKISAVEQLDKFGIEVYKSIEVDSYEELVESMKSEERTEFTSKTSEDVYLKPIPIGHLPWLPDGIISLQNTV